MKTILETIIVESLDLLDLRETIVETGLAESLDVTGFNLDLKTLKIETILETSLVESLDITRFKWNHLINLYETKV